MSDLGSPSAVPPPSRQGLKIAGAFALVLAIGGGAYGIASALGQGGPSAATTNPNTTSPSTTAPTSPGSRFGGGANGRTPRARPQALGTVQSVAARSFVVKSTNGSTVTVQVSSATTFSTTTGSSTYAAVKVGTQVLAYGTVSGSTLQASRVEVVPAGFGGGAGGFRGGFGPGAGSGTLGTVTSVAANSFVLRTFAGSNVTVDVSSSTKYAERGASSASFSDVKVGGRVAVGGSGTTTIKATTVDLLGSGGFGGGFGGGQSGPSSGGAGLSSASRGE